MPQRLQATVCGSPATGEKLRRRERDRRDVAPVVVVATAQMRSGLLDVLADLAGGLHDALLPVSAEQNVRSARAHYVKARAMGELLDDIGWTPGEIAPPHRLDLAVHGWAAVTALQRVIAREYFSTWQHAELQEMEASGRAGGFRDDAEHELRLIQGACERAQFTITPPKL